ncbi:MAG: type sorting protein [Bacteroidota bacterium]|jgi:hypothetical protein|nr:type sorting protein [Bacteroidota bacterium]
MNRIYALTFLILMSFTVQAQTWTWDTLTQANRQISLVKDYEGNVYSCSYGSNSFSKYTFGGIRLWDKVLPTSAVINKIICGTDNALYVTGIFQGSITINNQTLIAEGMKDLFLTKFDKDGLFQWIRQISSAREDEIRDICVDRNGKLLLTGSLSDTINFSGTIIPKGEKRDLFIARYDDSGNFETSFLSDLQSDYFLDGCTGGEIKTDSGNNIILLALINGTVGFDTTIISDYYSGYLMKLDQGFHLQWSERTECNYGVFVQNLMLNSADEIIYTLNGYGHYQDTGRIIKRNSAGQAPGEFIFLPQGHINGIDLDSSDNIYYASSECHWFFSPPYKYFTLFGRIGTNGNNTWQMSDSALSLREGASIVNSGDNLFVSGMFHDSADLFNNYSDTSAYFLGVYNLDHVGIDEKTALLSQFIIFPNPSTGKFTLHSNKFTSNKNICIHDILGNCIYNERSSSPEQIIDLSGKAKGIYFIEVTNEEKQYTQKLIVN